MALTPSRTARRRLTLRPRPEMLHADYDLLLFDVGNTLIHDEPIERLYFYHVFEGLRRFSPALTCEDFFAARISMLRRGELDWIRAFGLGLAGDSWQALSDEAWGRVLDSWDELTRPIRGVTGALEALSGRVRMAVLANQPPRALERLAALGFDRYFEFIALDSLVGLHKPDPAFFRWALERAGVSAGRVLYVGDRIDNDIKPAMSVGMKTAWIRHRPRDFPPSREPDRWCRLYLESAREVGSHNQHDYVAGCRTRDINFIAASVPQLFSTAPGPRP